MIEFDRVTVTYDGASEPALRDVSFTVPDPDRLGVQISGIARPGDSAERQP